MHTVQLTLLVFLAAPFAVSGELYFNVPDGVDRNAAQAALLERGIHSYSPAAPANPNGLYPGSSRGRETRDGPPVQPNAALPPPPGPGHLGGHVPVSVPLAPAHAEPRGGLVANEALPKAQPPQQQQQQQQLAGGAHGVLTSTVVALSTVAGPAMATASEPVALANRPKAVVAPAPVPAASGLNDDDDIVEAEEIESDDEGDAPASTTAAPARMAPSTPLAVNSITVSASIARTAPQTAPQTEQPLMLAKTSQTAFKPADLDKFSFPSSEASVNMAGPNAAPSPSASSSAAAASHKAKSAESSLSHDAKSKAMPAAGVSKAHVSPTSARSASGGPEADGAASIPHMALGALAVAAAALF